MSGDLIDIVSDFRCDGGAGPNMSDFMVEKTKSYSDCSCQKLTLTFNIRGHARSRHDKSLD